MNPFHSIVRRILGSADNSLRARVIQGGGIIIIGDLYANVLRLAANLLMTRLLFPEAFGLMLIVNLVLTALAMLSDLGIRGAIIVKHGELEDRYIHTAWTMSVVRGMLLGALALLLAYPISQFYQQDQLFLLMAIVSLAPVIQGFTSPYPIIYEKRVRFGRVVIWNTLNQTLAVGILLVGLLIHPAVWVLALHGVIGSAIAATTSYYLFPSKRMRFAWDTESAWQIFRVGRWIFVASGLSFLARQGDSLIISKWVTADQLGVFSIALNFAKLVDVIVERFSWSLLFPVYAEMRSLEGDSGQEHFNAQLRKVKLVLYAITAPLVLTFSLFGRDVIELLYDPRYHEAGWMLEIMAAGSAFFAAGAAIINIPMSFGDSYRHMWLQFFRFGVLLAVMSIGGMLGGIVGLVIGVAVSQALFYPILRVVTHKYGIRDYGIDMLFLGLLVVAIGITWTLRGWPV